MSTWRITAGWDAGVCRAGGERRRKTGEKLTPIEALMHEIKISESLGDSLVVCGEKSMKAWISAVALAAVLSPRRRDSPQMNSSPWTRRW